MDTPDDLTAGFDSQGAPSVLVHPKHSLKKERMLSERHLALSETGCVKYIYISCEVKRKLL